MSCIRLIPTVVFTLSLFIGCNDKKAVEQKHTDKGRQSTKVLEAADLVGYDGKRLKKTTDRVLDINNKRNQDMQKTIDDNE
jgi:hypothetical protein